MPTSFTSYVYVHDFTIFINVYKIINYGFSNNELPCTEMYTNNDNEIISMIYCKR